MNIKRILKVLLFLVVLFAAIFGATYLLFETYTLIECAITTLKAFGISALFTVFYYLFIEFGLLCFVD